MSTAMPTQTLALSGVRTAANPYSNKIHMRARFLTKRCEYCDHTFEIPNVRSSRLRELLIQYFPCTHCGFAKEVHYPRYELKGSCSGDCKLPFSLVGKHTADKCNPCYMRSLRHESEAIS